MKIVITGASGFVGSHLVEHLSQNANYQLTGTVFGDPPHFLTKFLSQENIISLNLLERENVFSVIQHVKPDWVFHLAALTSPEKSHHAAKQTYTNNIEAQLNLLDALLELESLPRTLIVGSAEEYGLVAPDDNPINESTPLRPTSPYAVSKIAQDFMGMQYYLTHKLPVIRVRPFNHTGERRPPTFVLPAFAKQVAEIEAGQKEPVIKVGNLEPVRDFTDVKDMVKAYELALLKGESGEVYNLGSGRPIQIKQLLDDLLELSHHDITVKTDPAKLRPVDIPKLVANSSKFTNQTGWQPETPLQVTIQRVLNYWRDEINNNHQ